ncbi:MAG: nucleotidyltransferase family protein [Bacteroidales bacterium]|nr:nucleotidyltransferase family protein [Bacteroidales bacterium]
MKFSDYYINNEASILEAIKQMDNIGKKLLIVMENERFHSMLSIGDLQRAIIRENSFNIQIKSILRPANKQRVAKTTDSFEDIKKTMLNYRTEYMPEIDEKNSVVNIHFWEDVFSQDEVRINRKVNLPVVVMAGGKGTRLKPITNVLPKPLIPVGDKTMLEHIMDRFASIGSNNFLISVNYKADMIQQYMDSLPNKNYKIEYFRENKPLGTAGSLSLLRKKLDEPFFVSNCDIIIEEDYSEIFNYHVENENELTIVAAIKNYPIPYGTLETSENGILRSLLEKPELTFKINSGMYILQPHLLNAIPEDKFYNITDLINKVIKRKGRVGVFPVSEGSWKDIGTWNEYLKII